MSESSPEEEEPASEAHTESPPEEEPVRELTPLVGELMQTAVRRLVARSRAEFGKAALAGRQRLEIRQQRKDLDHFWKRLGKTAYHLVEAGEVDHPALRKAMSRIDDLDAALKAPPRPDQDDG
jgi:hypothetical protein